MISIQEIRNKANKIIILNEHPAIIQSMLDFDYLSGKSEGSIVAIVTGRRGYAKYFFGRREILIPTHVSISGVSSTGDPSKARVGTPKVGGDSRTVNYWFFNNLSGRRTLSSVSSLLPSDFAGGVIFAEGVPELHSLQIIEQNTQLIIGPASVGLVVPGFLKLGAIGGITPDQVEEGKLTEPGHVAVVSGSGGMTNELINVAIQAGQRLSFALSYGGDRFPVLSPRDAFLLAESDPETTTVLYYGELGGEDEYELVKLKEDGKFTKHVIAHIAGTVASLFPESPQFGHAKAKADKEKTTALAKRAALKSAGFAVSNSFAEFIQLVNKLK